MKTYVELISEAAYTNAEIEGLIKNSISKKVLYITVNKLGDVETVSDKDSSKFDYKVYQYKIDSSVKLSPLKLRSAIQSAFDSKEKYYVRSVKNNPIELIVVE